jgi:hypothetical protein
LQKAYKRITVGYYTLFGLIVYLVNMGLAESLEAGDEAEPKKEGNYSGD